MRSPVRPIAAALAFLSLDAAGALPHNLARKARLPAQLAPNSRALSHAPSRARNIEPLAVARPASHSFAPADAAPQTAAWVLDQRDKATQSPPENLLALAANRIIPVLRHKHDQVLPANPYGYAASARCGVVGVHQIAYGSRYLPAILDVLRPRVKK